MNYPSRQQESEIIDRTTSESPGRLSPVVTGPEIIEFQDVVRKVPLPEHAKQLVLDLVRALRPDDQSPLKWAKELLDWGPGPRACQQLVLASKARALLEGRYHVSIEDITALALPVLRHRVVLSFAAESQGLSADQLITRALHDLPQPKTRVL